VAIHDAHQKVVLSATILTVPGNLPLRVNVSSISIPSSESHRLNSVTRSSVSHSSSNHGGEPDERNIPAAAACVSVGELREADGLILLGPREFRAIKICGGFKLVVIADRSSVKSGLRGLKERGFEVCQHVALWIKAGAKGPSSLCSSVFGHLRESECMIHPIPSRIPAWK
jgi:hypothetical protein